MKALYLYILVPTVLLLMFLFTPGVGYFSAQKQIAVKVAALEEQKAEEKAEADRKRKEVEAKAAEDARARQAQRDAEDRARIEKKEREYQDVVSKLTTDIADYSAEADRFAKESADLEIQLTRLRARKEQLTRDAFELAKQVEMAKINRRNAEIEIQRMVDMVAQRLNASPLSAPPPPPPPTPAR